MVSTWVTVKIVEDLCYTSSHGEISWTPAEANDLANYWISNFPFVFVLLVLPNIAQGFLTVLCQQQLTVKSGLNISNQQLDKILRSVSFEFEGKSLSENNYRIKHISLLHF